MAYVDMAHSHVQRLLREGMHLEKVVQDDDGDYPFRHGSAAYFLSLSPDGRLVRVWARAVFGVAPKAAVLREVNDTNSRLVHSRAYVKNGCLMLDAVLPVEQLDAEHLSDVCHEIGCTADRLGQLVAAVHGGHVWFDEPADATG